MNKTERDIINPQKLLVPQNHNSAFREIIQFLGVPETEYALQCRMYKCYEKMDQLADTEFFPILLTRLKPI